MKAICEGRKTRQAVVRETIEQYRAVYLLTQSRMNILHAVSVVPNLMFALGSWLTFIQSVRRYVLGQNG